MYTIQGETRAMDRVERTTIRPEVETVIKPETMLTMEDRFQEDMEMLSLFRQEIGLML